MAATTNSNPASGAGLEIGRIREAAWGTTPASAALTAIRARPFRMVENPSHFTSAEANRSRIIQQIRKVYKGPSWTIPTELIYGNIDGLLELVMQAEWNSDTLTESTTFLSDTLEGKYGDAAVPFYIAQTGAVAQGLTLNIDGTGENPVMAELTGIAQTHNVSETTLDTDVTTPGEYDAAPTGNPMVAAQCAVEIDDTSAVVQSLTATINPNMEALRAIGFSGPARIAANGERSVTGQAVFFLDDKTYLEKLQQDGSIKIEAMMRDAVTGYNELKFTVPTAHVMNAVPSNVAGALSVTVDWQAKASAVVFDRTDAA